MVQSKGAPGTATDQTGAFGPGGCPPGGWPAGEWPAGEWPAGGWQKQTRPRLSFHEFWRLYLDAHRHPGTRGMHYGATVLGAAAAGLSVALEQVAFVLAGIPLAVVMAVGSHWLIERNQPLIKVNAFFGALADMRMCWLALTGGLAGEYRRLGLGSPEPAIRRAPAE